MAARKAKYPVVRKFTIDTDGTSDIYVDVGRCLSMVNHRLYRQGRLYRVRVSITSPTQTSIHAVTALPDTWWARRAYSMVKDIWMSKVEARKKTLGKGSVGRWNDFKVGYDNTHRGAFGDSKLPELVTDATGTQAAMTTGNAQWELSVMNDNDGTATSFCMIGSSASTGRFNVIDTYDNITNVFSPDPEETGQGMNSYADFYPPQHLNEDDSFEDDGEYPPYHETNFPQLEVLQGQLTCTADMGTPANGQGIQRLSTGYFDAPLGLLRITPGGNEELTIEVQAGDYKGVEAPEWV